jgi:hypothetical protein
MPATESSPWFHSSQSVSGFECGHCKALLRHEQWCITQCPDVRSAWEIVLDPSKLSLHDELILHALGVAWVVQRPQAAFRTAAASQ